VSRRYSDSEYGEFLRAIRAHHPIQKRWEALKSNSERLREYLEEVKRYTLHEGNQDMAKASGLMVIQHLEELARNRWLREQLKDALGSRAFWRVMAMAAAAVAPKMDEDDRITLNTARAILETEGWEHVPEAWDTLYFLAPANRGKLQEFRRALRRKLWKINVGELPEPVQKRLRELKEL